MGNWKKSRVRHELRVVLSSLIGFSLRALSDDVSHIFMSAPDWMRWLLTQEVYFIGDLDYSAKGRARSLEAHTNEITIRTNGWKISETCDVCTTGWQPKANFGWTGRHMSRFLLRKHFWKSSILLTSLLFDALEKRRFAIEVRSIRASAVIFLGKKRILSKMGADPIR